MFESELFGWLGCCLFFESHFIILFFLIELINYFYLNYYLQT
jgi:hypothetical protein